MSDIICPHCSKVFKVDEASYANILHQVRNSEFDQEVHKRLQIAEREKTAAVALAKSEADKLAHQSVASKDKEIQSLRSALDAREVDKKLAVQEAITSVQAERDKLINTLAQVRQESQSAFKLACAEHSRQLSEALADKDSKIQALKARIDSAESANRLEIAEAVGTIAKERDELKSNLEKAELKRQLGEQSLKDRYEIQLKDRDEAIERLRDLKARLSTKMIGETLEQHCETEFNRIRATAFPLAYFEKDNDVRSGSKGDYIFRDANEAGTEIVSIMFEMKNEFDITATKKKNEDFLKALDRDRKEKGCEYAVLVSLLEPHSKLYNAGIVDMFHRYPKMYVIRPQFFIPIITLLRNAAMKSLEYKAELALVKAQNIDITNFENDLESFKSSFAKNYDLASRKFQTAIEEIDKSISHLQKTKDALLGTDRNLRLANSKAQEVSIKRLTRRNPTMAEMFGKHKKQPVKESE